MYTILQLIGLCVCFAEVYCTLPTRADTCHYWGEIASGYSQIRDDEGARRMSCQAKNSTGSCNGFSCTGYYNMKLPLPITQRLNFSFCFGVSLNHCDNPPSLDYYLQIPGTRNVQFYDRVKVNESKPISNLTIGSRAVHIQPFLFFMYANGPNNHVFFEVKIKCKLSLYGFEQWPERLQVTVFPRQEIPYTTCSGTATVPPLQKPPPCNVSSPSTGTTIKPHSIKPHPTKNPPHVKPTKKPVVPTKSSFKPPTTGKTTISISDGSKRSTSLKPSKLPRYSTQPYTYSFTNTTSKSVSIKLKETLGKACIPGAMQGESCGVNETCVGNGKKGICDCQTNFKKEDGFCKPSNNQGPAFPTWIPAVKKTTPAKGTTPHPHVSAAPVVSHTATGTKINMTALIVGSVLGGLIVIVLIATIVVFVVRKRRMYYRGHQLLLSEDDTDVVI